MASAGEILARKLFNTLAAKTADPPGMTRAAYGPGEQFAHDLMRGEAEALGCACQTDAPGNLYMTWQGSDPDKAPLFIGSHLDTVPHGGNYDGAAGVIAGMAVIANLAEAGFKPARGLTVMAVRAEEAAWFPLSYLGSKAAFGVLPARDLDAKRSDTGQSLAWHIGQAGFDPDAVERGEAFLKAAEVGAFLELHIEQGPVLADANCPVGIVTAMNGGFRYTEARCTGNHAHSGAEPRHTRKDAVLGFADLVARLEDDWDMIEAQGNSCTITVGRLATDPAHHSASKVAGDLRFSLDFRSASASVLRTLKKSLVRHTEDISRHRGVRFELGEELTWPIVDLDPGLQDGLERSAADEGVETLRLSSGGGHDAATFAEAGVRSAMVFVRSYNGSHNPDERMEMTDFDRALQVLSSFARNLCCR